MNGRVKFLSWYHAGQIHSGTLIVASEEGCGSLHAHKHVPGRGLPRGEGRGGKRWEHLPGAVQKWAVPRGEHAAVTATGEGKGWVGSRPGERDADG